MAASWTPSPAYSLPVSSPAPRATPRSSSLPQAPSPTPQLAPLPQSPPPTLALAPPISILTPAPTPAPAPAPAPVARPVTAQSAVAATPQQLASRSQSPLAASHIPKRTLLSRLRRHPVPVAPSAFPIPMAAGRGQDTALWDKRATRPAPRPPSSGASDTSLSLHSEGVARGTGKNMEMEAGMGMSGDAKNESEGWERIRTLPRVRLVPPEDEGEPILLYPPPPPKPPPVLVTAQPASRPQWTGMEHSFSLPTPAFSRRKGGVVMPKRRAEVVADQRRRSWQDWGTSRDRGKFEHEHGPEGRESTNSVVALAASAGEIRQLEYFVSETDSIPSLKHIRPQETAHRSAKEQVDSRVAVPHSEAAFEAGEVDLAPSQLLLVRAHLPLSPSEPPSVASPSSRAPVSQPVPVPASDTTSAPLGAPAALPAPATLESVADLAQPPTPPPKSKAPRRKARALSLTSALAAKVLPVIPHDEDVPPIPPLRKQKSLKKFFFPDESSAPAPPQVPPLPPISSTSTSASAVSSSVAVPVPLVSVAHKVKDKEKQKDKEKRNRGLLSRAKSRPSLLIDVRASRAVQAQAAPTPALSASSERLPETPPLKTPSGSAGGLSKRFSLSNMSQAFRKARSGSSVPVPAPHVPVLPDAYRKETKVKEIKMSALPLGRSTRAYPLSSPPSIAVDLPFASASTSTADAQPSAAPLGLGQMQIRLMDPIALNSAVRTPRPFADSLPSSPVTSLSLSLSLSLSEEVSEGVSEEVSADPEDPDGDALTEELTHAQLMHISPRTRLDPASRALQDHVVGRAAAPCAVVCVDAVRRESVCGLIGLQFELGSGPGAFDSTLQSVAEREGGNESDSSLDSTAHEPVTPDPGALPVILPPISILQYAASATTSPPLRPNAASGTQQTGSPASLVAPTPASTPRSRFTSPEAFLRKLGSPRSAKFPFTQSSPKENGSTSDSPRSGVARDGNGRDSPLGLTSVVAFPRPSIEVGSVREQGFSSLASQVQLKSLHFDSLGLDFGHFHFQRESIARR